jgi:serine/threonine protein kinase/tetratricopeptide (TPR) repeat protein
MMSGTRLAHYRILDLLGAGGMGQVYRAHDEQLDRDVAIKLLPAGSLQDPAARARLTREARAAAALNHPSICTIHEVGEAEGQTYIAMELVEGRPLSELAAGRGLPVDEVLRCGRQIADALAHAHSRQIIHRDLKSANVVVTPDGHLKVLDFGLAKKVSGAALTEATTQAHVHAEHTAAGTLVGTLAYMAPEQLRGEIADARSDLWALGIVLYELATGGRPFKGQSGFELSANILNQPSPSLPSTVPIGLRGVIERCLDKQPGRRFQTANEVRAALDAIEPGTGVSWTSLRYRLSRRPWLTTAAAVVLVAALAAALARDQIRSRWFEQAPRVESVAVLPLENLSGDAAQDYFADGMTEVLSTDLARLSGFKRVTARGSVQRYKGTRKPFEEIARELKVDALITGSVLRSGNRVSITAQLLNPATGDQLWSNRYERDAQDVLVIRNEIVTAIVREIKAQLSPAEQARLASASRVNPEAFENYLKGQFYWYKQTRADYDLAERYFQAAIDKDPNYALAHAGLGTVWMMRSDAGFLPASETMPKAEKYFARALALDDKQSDLHVTLGNHKLTEWDWAGAEREFKQAIALNPNLADAHFFYADLLVGQKRPQEWEPEIKRALELDPLNDFNRTYYGWQLNYLRRYDEAIPIFTQLLATGPNKAANYLGLWGAYFRKGMYAEAIANAREYFVAAGDGEFAATLSVVRDAAAYQTAMTRTGEAMIEGLKRRHVPALRIARMFAHAGQNDRAIEWLEKAYVNRESPLARLAVVWDWLDLHGDPRFQDLLRRLKLP